MILSIDIGIKNLALCCMSSSDHNDFNSYKIHLWNVFDTLDTEDHFCTALKKNGEPCGKKCMYKYNSKTILGSDNIIYTCKSHFPKELLPMKKQNHYKKKLINDYLLQDIVTIILTKVQHIYDTNKTIFNEIKSIIIELQPKLNPKMGLMSHVIYGKLVELYFGTSTTVRFVRASQKLKAYTGPKLECALKGKYAQRKWLSIQYTRWFLKNKFPIEQQNLWSAYFENHLKKDDLSDCYLMAINAIAGLPKRQTTDKNGKCIK